MVAKTLGHYQILESLGAGGMGEVYRARDTKLDRDVALKVLPEGLASDPDRLARLVREAKLLASLNHAGIATIYGMEESGGVRFIVMEVVEGETLAEHLARGPMPVELALAIGSRIAEALEAAHERGVIHRDLKPANVMLTTDWKVKVLDFGLAKAFETLGPEADPSESPTIAEATQAGAILGTVVYMSPEQARGQSLDKRTDIWSFGCLLYEMLTARSAFAAETTSDTLASILKEDPDWRALPADMPRQVTRLLQRCLSKDPRQRLRDIGDARIEIDEAIAVAAESGTATRDDRPASGATTLAKRWGAPAAVAAAFLVTVMVLSGGFQPGQPASAPSRPLVADIAPPEGWAANSVDGPPALSPDGTRLAFVGESENGGSLILVRDLENGETLHLTGTRNARSPFWSPDGVSLGFFADGKLKRIDIAGGTPKELADAPEGHAGSWSVDDRILFVPRYETSTLSVVDPTGGAVEALPSLAPDAPQAWATWPLFLPDGDSFLVSLFNIGEARDGIYLASLAKPDALRRLVPAVSNSAFVAPDWLLYWEQGTLVARRIDLQSRTATDEVHRIANNVAFSPNLLCGRFTASAAGRLVYQPSSGVLGDTELVLVDRQGRELSIVAERGEYYSPRLSHDGRQVAVDITEFDKGMGDIWTIDLERGVRTRLSRSRIDASVPVWSPDDMTLFFFNGHEIQRRDASGAIAASTLFEEASGVPFPNDVSPNGRYLLFHNPTAGIWMHDLKTGESNRWVDGGFYERLGRFSPDGRWVAYTSEESGRAEIYLQRFPDAGERIVVSTDGGRAPSWRGDGGELYFVSAAREIVAVPIEWNGGRPSPGAPTALFSARLREDEDFDVMPDGQRMLLNRVLTVDTRRPFVLRDNWREGL